jgi:predicted DNA-binding transcriptional regulator YafY
LTLQKYVRMTSASRATAYRDITELLAAGILSQEGRGRGTYYNLTIPGWGWKPAARRDETPLVDL